MLRGLYSAATGMDVASTAQDAIAENIAHADVPGYRRRGVAVETFEDALLAQTPSPAAERELWGARVSTVYNDFTPGPVQKTDNPLDVAASPDTFFVVDGPNGPVFTKNGTFLLTSQGELVASNGFRVRGEGGRIQVPTDTVRIDITADGGVLADGQEVGRLQLSTFPNPFGLTRVGTTLFQGGGIQRNANQPGQLLVQQGFREASNVQVATEMTAMIQGLRHFEACQRALRALAEAVAQNTRPQAGS